MTPDLLTVPLGERAYDIFLGTDIYPIFQEWICRFFPGRPVFVVSDRNVASIYGDDIRRRLAGIPHSVHAVPAGEEHKTWETVREIYRFLAQGRADRESLVVAFGGGVVGDLAGFAAATFLRGIPYVQLPTTLLAQVDSSVGGKTGFNLPDGKNLVGAFHQPRAVFIDSAFLRTLDARNLRAGMAEVVKCGLAGDEALWNLVCERGADWEGMTDGEWREAIRRSVAVKADIVTRDERESSVRRVLNLGHTIGHALEQASGYGRLLHGEAVAMGLAWEAVFARRLGMTPPEFEERLCALLNAMGFALDDPELGLAPIAAAIGMDKKRVAGDLLLPVVEAPGRCVLKRIPVEALRQELPSVRADVRDRVRAADPDAQRLAREIEATLDAAGGKESPHPLEDVVLLEEGAFALRPAEEEPQPGAPGVAAEPPAAGGEEGAGRPGGAATAPDAVPVRTITMANVYWEQGERDVARRIVRAILAEDPGDARAEAWLAQRPQSDEEEALAAFLETIAKEYAHDISGTH